MAGLGINFLDQVAIRVRDIKASLAWYQKVQGLSCDQVPDWGKFPVFLFAGKCGIAIIPANSKFPEIDPDGHTVELTTLVVPESEFFSLGKEA